MNIPDKKSGRFTGTKPLLSYIQIECQCWFCSIAMCFLHTNLWQTPRPQTIEKTKGTHGVRECLLFCLLSQKPTLIQGSNSMSYPLRSQIYLVYKNNIGLLGTQH